LGQKVHPIGFRVGVSKDWDSRWYGEKNYAAFAHEDREIRRFIKKRMYHAGIAKIKSSAPPIRFAPSSGPRGRA